MTMSVIVVVLMINLINHCDVEANYIVVVVVQGV